MNNEAQVKDFFKKIKEGKLSSLDMYNKAELLTDKFDPGKLQLLENDFLNSVTEDEMRRQREEKGNLEFSKVLMKIKDGILPSKKKLDQKQIALIHHYEGKVITRNNANEIAKSYGHKSGERLYILFTYYRNHENRTKGSEDAKKFRIKIALIESVIPSLKTSAASVQAMKEVNEMKEKEKQYE